MSTRSPLDGLAGDKARVRRLGRRWRSERARLDEPQATAEARRVRDELDVNLDDARRRMGMVGRDAVLREFWKAAGFDERGRLLRAPVSP